MIMFYVMDNPFEWEEYLSLVQFAYSNGYDSSLNLSLFEALYGRKSNMHIC